MKNRLLLLPLVACLAPSLGWAQSPGEAELIARLKDRGPKLSQIFHAEQAGEGIDGYVVPLPADKAKAPLTEADQALIAAENDDRKALFGVIGAESGLTASELASMRAKQIRDLNVKTSTVWFQEPDDKFAEGFHWVAPGASPGSGERGTFVWTKPATKGVPTAMYAAPGGATVDDNVPGFSSYYVLETKPAADGNWYRVGSLPPGGAAEAQPLGWMRERDVLPQPHRLVLSFANDANRDKLEVFGKKEDALALAALPEAERAAEYDRLWDLAKKIAAGKAERPVSFPLVTVEPDVAPEIFKTFYVMPVLRSEKIMLDSTVPARLVKLASATLPSSGKVKSENLNVDVVFVVDTTGSMQPYIDQVVGMCRKMAESLQDGKTAFRFGCWGYRDLETKDRRMEYLTKSFAPTLKPIAEFTKILDNVKANVETVDEPEEAVLDGVADAILKTDWRPNSARIIVLVGDEPPLPASFRGSPDNKGNLDLKRVRDIADEQRISLLAINIQNPKSSIRFAKATAAYSALATNRGSSGGAAYFPIAGGTATAFGKQAGTLMNTIIFAVRTQAGEAATMPPIGKEDLEKLNFMLKPMMRSLASQIENEPAPTFQEGWAISKGVKKPNLPVFEVCVFATHAELDTCVSNLQRLVEANQTGALGGQKFYEDVQRLILKVFFPTLSNTKDHLPYPSKLLETSFDQIKEKSPDEFNEFWEIVAAKIKGLRSKLDQEKGIFGPTYKNAAKDDWVTAISLDAIP